MWLVTTGIMYLHHSAVDKEYNRKIDEGANMQMISRTTGAFEELKPNLNISTAPDKFEELSIYEDELI